MHDHLTSITPEIEDIDLQWLDEQTILHIQFQTVHRNNLFELEEYIASLVEDWPKGKPFLILVDFSAGQFSPNIKKISLAIAQKLEERNITGKRAVILPSGFLAGLVKTWATRLQRQNNILQNCFFNTTEDALAWLRE